MGVKYICDITGEEFNRTEMFKKVIPVTVTVTIGSNNQKLGGLYISKEELPTELKSRIEAGVGSWQTQPKITVQVTGNITPVEDSISPSNMMQGGQNKIQYKYLSEDPKISGVTLHITALTPHGKLLHTFNYDKSEDKVSDFVDKVEDKVLELCTKRHEQNSAIKEQQEDEPRGSGFA